MTHTHPLNNTIIAQSPHCKGRLRPEQLSADINDMENVSDPWDRCRDLPPEPAYARAATSNASSNHLSQVVKSP